VGAEGRVRLDRRARFEQGVVHLLPETVAVQPLARTLGRQPAHAGPEGQLQAALGPLARSHLVPILHQVVGATQSRHRVDGVGAGVQHA
jgi:hypothetical protein